MIEKYFERYPGSIISFNYVGGVKTLHYWMPNTWEIPEGALTETILLRADPKQVDKQNPNRYYSILYTQKVVQQQEETESLVVQAEPTFDDIYNVLVDIFEFNMERERKEALLQAKIAELQEKFANLSLDQLVNLEFK